ncbi:DUF1826 domain-containing protein [Epilithonimonas arachidiradicis]|uniref:DUF1826 domain-containing protein n=1 Tax=Epilithonimonas arachidiradicis TaxID=1617282 RepID=A0A420D8N6_9FLAO|nr:DUF1826 domain-containing protein [Epilithonimonas arachidiradicis]RKE87217.1 hypothetical protein BXY58_2093 [Epilithonimonas arachidiradicis]GGG59211.1 hypothetical protein GCM10007332_21080 [Epilithonimonas arachidiradicis]
MKNEFSNNSQIKVVSGFSQLVETNFSGTMNAICWERHLVGDFKEIVSKLELKDNITEISIDDLLTLNLSANGVLAREIILSDLRLLTDFGASPSLNLLKKYERDDEFDFISTDVYSYHVDRSPFGTDTFLCTYYGAASDILPNDQAEQKVLIPEIRDRLKELHNDQDGDFEDFLKDNYFDLHYQPKANAKSINLGLGHLWRLSVDHPEQKVPPCVHRAPTENDGEYRLLLIC